MKNSAAVVLGRLGGKAGSGAAKRRSTSFDSATASAAKKKYWEKWREKKAEGTRAT
ncbi:MAG: hypothetical protein KGL39_44450 [Patescibacteria group bacterium]|nr:hypothetical protein [Patescibacteria group bacterium]